MGVQLSIIEDANTKNWTENLNDYNENEEVDDLDLI